MFGEGEESDARIIRFPLRALAAYSERECDRVGFWHGAETAYRTKGSGSRVAALTMVSLVEAASWKWHRLDSANLMEFVISEKKLADGVLENVA